MAMSTTAMRKVTITGEGQESLNSLKGALQGVADAQGRVASVTDIASKRQLSAADAYKRQTLAVVEGARAQEQLARAVKVANDAFAQGRLGDVNSAAAKSALAERISLLNQKYGEASTHSKALSAATGTMTTAFGAARNAAASFGLVLGVGAIVAYGKRIFDATADLQEQADQILGSGGNVEALQALRGVFLTTGISAEGGDKILSKLTRSLGEASEGSDKAQQAFKRLGLGSKDLAGASADAALPLIAQKLLEITDETKRAAIEVAIFGKSGQQLESALRSLQTPMDEMIARGKELGIVIDADMIKKADDAKDAMALSFAKLSVALTPIIVEWSAGFSEFATRIGGATSNLEKLIRAVQVLGGVWAGAKVGALFGPYGGLAGALMGGLTAYGLTMPKAQPLTPYSGAFNFGPEKGKAPPWAPSDKTVSDYEKVRETFDQHLTSLREAAKLAGQSSVQKEMELTVIKAAGVSQTELGVLAREQVKSYEQSYQWLSAHGQLLPVIAALEEKRTNSLSAQNDKIKDSIDLLNLQISIAGQSDMARALAMAEAQQRQVLSAQDGAGYDPNNLTDEQQRSIDLKQEEAAANVILAETQAAVNASMTEASDRYAEMADSAAVYASHIGDTFGTVGRGFAQMVVSLETYASKQAKFAERQDAISKLTVGREAAQIKLTREKSNAEGEYYAETISGVKNLFDQKSGAYKALSAIEAAYSAVQIARALIETPVFIAAGAAKMFAFLGPFGFAAVAAMVAVMAGLGFSGAGGGTSGNLPSDIADQRQSAQGAGSILGDSAAKSESIAKSLDVLEKNSNADLEYSNQMVSSLRSIQSGIGDLSALLARELGVNGLFNTAGLGLGESSSGVGSGIPLIGGIISSLFGSSSSKTTLLDQGIQIAATTIGAAVAGGISANAYQTTQTDSKSSSFFGLFSSSSTSQNTKSSGLGSQFTDQIAGIVGGLRGAVLDAATKLGVEGAASVIDSFSINLGSISFKDMTGAEIKDALNSVFSKLGDDISAAVFPEIASMQQVGEGTLETLSRLVAEFTAVDNAMALMGKTFGATGLASLGARDALVQAAGGLDAFTSQAQFFTDNFITSAAALVPVAKAVRAEMTRLGASAITTKDEFAALVQGIDVSTGAGAALYSALMKVAPAFAKVTDAANDLADQRTGLEIRLLQAQGDALAATALQRHKEADALDASLRPLLALIHATEDLAAAQTALTTATANVAAAQKALDGLLSPAVNTTANLTAAHSALANAYRDESSVLSNAVAAAHQDLANAYSAESQAIENTKAQFQGLADSLRDFGDTLANGPLAAGGALSQYKLARGSFLSTSAAARGGDADALGRLQQAGSEFLSSSSAASGSRRQYMLDLIMVRDAVAKAGAVAQGKVSDAQQQLDALTASVAGLNVVAKELLSVRAAIEALHAATLAQTVGQAALDVSVAGLGVINVSVLSVKDAIDNLAAAQSASDAVSTAAIVKAQTDLATAVQKQTEAQVAVATLTAAAVTSKSTAETAAAVQAQVVAAVVAAVAAAEIVAPTPDPVAPATPSPVGQYAHWTQADLDYLWNSTGDSDPVELHNNSAYQMLQSLGFPRSLSDLPGHASGLGYVPYDNYVFRAHRGEAVLPANDAAKWRGNGGGETVALLSEMRAMRSESRRLAEQTEKNTRKTAMILTRVTQDGVSLQTTATT
jgi:hypothetical protein